MVTRCNTSSSCFSIFNGSQSDLLEIANNSPIILGAQETNTSVTDGWTFTSSSKTVNKTEGDCSLSLTQNDCFVQTQLTGNSNSSLCDESSFYTSKGAISKEKPFVNLNKAVPI